jgi:hypothetical protein
MLCGCGMVSSGRVLLPASNRRRFTIVGIALKRLLHNRRDKLHNPVAWTYDDAKAGDSRRHWSVRTGGHRMQLPR